ncbi:serine/threonine-protein phosphatase 6 regulatory ankyrin repeat subunit C-like [Periplaneta americana]|uniref:serine/threonine-protein phosphatase 6 regulatory ankyrin repeat subunit C-like n=1 Tax=Periplaneta americana TaxID=6978 RepID=UPI0037E76BA7
MVPAGLITVLLGCFIAGYSLILYPITPHVVRVREGDSLTLLAHVESDEENLWFFRPGNIYIGDYDHRASITREELTIQLHIWRVDRFQSGVYFLKGFDAGSNERCNWTVVVQVVPEFHVSVEAASTFCISEESELSCEASQHGDVVWEYLGCNVTVWDTDRNIIKEYDQCAEFSTFGFLRREELLLEAARSGDITDVSLFLMMATLEDNSFRLLESPLCAASRGGHVEVAQLLMNVGANHSIVWSSFVFANGLDYEKHMTPLHCAALSGSVRLVEMFFSRGINLITKDRFYRDLVIVHAGAPFLFAGLSGSLPLVQAFLSWGVDPNHKDSDGHSLLFYAALSGSLSVVQHLIDVGANKLSVDSRGNTPLFFAAHSGSLSLVKFLVSIGLNPLQENSFGETAIFPAVYSGSVSMLEAFLEWGVNASSVNTRKESLLHIAARRGDLSIAKCLIKAGINPNILDDYSKTPLLEAEKWDDQPLIELFRKSGVSTGAVN